MNLKLAAVALSFLGAVVLCGAQSSPPTVAPASSAAVTQAPATGSANPPATVPDASTGPAGTDPTVLPDPATTGPVDPGTQTAPVVTTDAVGESSSGLSSGAIAGITIGSLAGVAALGGGVFGALKYTGKI